MGRRRYAAPPHVQGLIVAIPCFVKTFSGFPTEEGQDGTSRTWADTSDYTAVQPPSIKMVCPVISEAAGEARNITAPVTSTGSASRCSAAKPSTTPDRKTGWAQ